MVMFDRLANHFISFKWQLIEKDLGALKQQQYHHTGY